MTNKEFSNRLWNVVLAIITLVIILKALTAIPLLLIGGTFIADFLSAILDGISS